MWEATTFSSILEMKLRFEMGRELLRSSVDRDESVDKWIEMVFRRGWARACLSDDGKIPPKRERLTRFARIEPISLKHSFKNEIKMKSREHCLLSKAEVRF